MTSSCRGSSMVAEDCSEYDSHPGNILVHKLCYSTLIENFTKFDRNEILPYQTTTSKPESNLFIIRSYYQWRN